MKCPFCGSIDDKVVDSRLSQEKDVIRRRRECKNCGKRFTTYEKIGQILLMVRKKDGTTEPFNRDKILIGLSKACEKRPVSLSMMEKIADEIEAMVMDDPSKEISSKKIGEHIMRRLQDIDEVAYIRFASVYRQFKDISQFVKILETLKKQADGK